MLNFDDVTGKNETKHSPNWSYIRDHSYGVIIFGSSGSGKTRHSLI